MKLTDAICRRRFGFDGALSALAAVLSKVSEQTVHAVEGCAIDEVSARALLGNQTSVRQFLKVEGQRA